MVRLSSPGEAKPPRVTITNYSMRAWLDGKIAKAALAQLWNDEFNPFKKEKERKDGG